MRSLLPILLTCLLLAAADQTAEEPIPVPAETDSEPVPVIETAADEEESEPSDLGAESFAEPAPSESVPKRESTHPSVFVEIVCAETGRRLPVKKVVATDGPSDNTRFDMAPVEGGWHLDTFPIPSWGFATIGFVAEPPPGHVMESPGRFGLDLTPTRFTKHIRARIVAWPEADLRVTVRKSGGGPAPYARVEWVKFGEFPRTVRAALTDERGETRIHGLPSVPGETVLVVARRGRRVGRSETLSLGRSTETIRAQVFLPPRPARDSFFGCWGVDCDGCSRDPKNDPPEGTAGLRVEVRRVGGDPGAGARVTVSSPTGVRPPWRKYGRADRFGNARFDGLPSGPVEVQVREPGYVMAHGSPVDLASGRTVDRVVEEDRGVPLTIAITEPGGRPLAGVELEIRTENGVDCAWVEGATERVGFFTDADGRFTFPRLPEGGVEIRARLGSRIRHFEVEAGGTERRVFGAE